ncbi:sensor histidine kinase [Gracilibacillus sp. YIM 98692]|uniref:sensor histidine kinase n=1 Tax=Gracilibacillus sp. YIM 98692 TaxID=2663532 RepID=UPI0013D06FF2|nr:sensor histidine kinase [Gracilibacillus sp. YIM 98692]
MRNMDRDLDYIIEEMIDTVKNSKDEIFDIAEDSRKEYDNLSRELNELKEEVNEVIDEGDRLEKKSRLARQRLSVVSKNFQDYSDEEIHKVYDQAHQFQSEFMLKREKEQSLRERRDQIEMRLKSIEEMMGRAEGLVGKISIVLNYLSEDFKNVSDILQTAQEKQAFGLKIIEAQEEERRRLSREMHDGPAQMLANILIRSEIVERAYKKGNLETAVEEMRSVRSMIRDSLQEVRRIIYDLRPMALDDLGLVPTIKKYLATVEDGKPTIHFSHHATQSRMESQYEVAVFRLIQESVQNALKHAEAQSINVILKITEDRIQVKITDDGKGFDQKENKEHSFGIIGMKERMDMLGGTFQITTELDKGTTVYIDIPITQEENEIDNI